MLVTDYERQVDVQISSSFSQLDYEDILSGSLDKGFAKALSLIGEVLKINASIGSCDVLRNLSLTLTIII